MRRWDPQTRRRIAMQPLEPPSRRSAVNALWVKQSDEETRGKQLRRDRQALAGVLPKDELKE